MKKYVLLSFLVLGSITLLVQCFQTQPAAKLISSNPDQQWVESGQISSDSYNDGDPYDIEILLDNPEQTIDGFGGSFNELGWEALRVLNEEKKKEIIGSIFGEEGLNFTVGRMPIGANDFAVDWYSLDDTPNDYDMKNFNIERDKTRIIPYIKMAMEFKPDLKIWGSPWAPPSWMKKNDYYACSPSPYNDLDPSLPRNENGDTQFILDEKTQQAYALYFTKYVQAYTDQGIDVYAVHVQNEPHSCQPFPSSLWKGPDLKNFIRDYLGPTLQETNPSTEIWYGTFERPYEGEFKDEIDMLLEDQEAMKYITGFGFQWAGKQAIPNINRLRPDLKMMHTEVECGNGKNTWEYAEYVYGLLQHYFNNGANSQMYWNMILSKDQVSTWGWEQNSLISVDQETKEVAYNPEYYVMKHFSHFVKPGARKLAVTGKVSSELAFQNSDGELILVTHNETDNEKTITVKVDERLITVELPQHSINTIILSDS